MYLRYILVFSKGRHKPIHGGKTFALQATDDSEKTNIHILRLPLLKNGSNQIILKLSINISIRYQPESVDMKIMWLIKRSYERQKKPR